MSIDAASSVGLFSIETYRCPRCGEKLSWAKKPGGWATVASCCHLGWALNERCVPVRAWGTKRYHNKRIDNYWRWGREIYSRDTIG